MTIFAIIAGILLVGAAAVQWAIGSHFEKSFLNKEKSFLPVDQQDPAVVIMSVRGCDPSLKDSLIGIMNQEYENYSVHLVVDHRTDQAWEFVHELKSTYDSRDVLKIFEMENPPETCSLKCHAIVQALEQIENPKTTYVALLDADVKPHSTWLAELLGPLADPTVGGSTGNQWFEPQESAKLGSLVRSTWNGGALVLTLYFGNPWAGSFGMRLKDLKAAGLEEIWRQSVVDDGPIKQAINNIGLMVEVAPSLIMVNREPCTIAYANRWVTRMLTWSRLYEKTFFLSIIHAAFSNTVMLGNFAVLFVSLGLLHVAGIAISAAALISSGLICAVSYMGTRRCVAKSCQLRGEELEPPTIRRFVEVFWMIAVAHLVYGVSCLKALTLKQIKWREITYELKSHNEIKRLDYQPYAATAQSKVSI